MTLIFGDDKIAIWAPELDDCDINACYSTLKQARTLKLKWQPSMKEAMAALALE